MRWRNMPMTTMPMTRAMTAVLMFAMLVAAGCSGSDSADTTSSTTEVVSDTTTTSTTEAPLEAGTQLYVYNPSIGDCFERRELDVVPGDDNKQTEITLKLPCDLPHRNEIFDVIDYPSTPDYPGEPTLRDYAKRNCVRGFQDFVGSEYELSSLEIGYVIPTPQNWGPGRERIGCYVYDSTGERLVGSMRGSQR